MILAGNDATDADLALRAAQGDLHNAAWKLIYQSNQLSAYLDAQKKLLGAP